MPAASAPTSNCHAVNGKGSARIGKRFVNTVPAAQLKPGRTVQAEELARLHVPYAVDNLEGLYATRGPRGETLLWLMSDNNFNPLQRTILLLFELK